MYNANLALMRALIRHDPITHANEIEAQQSILHAGRGTMSFNRRLDDNHARICRWRNSVEDGVEGFAGIEPSQIDEVEIIQQSQYQDCMEGSISWPGTQC